MKKNSTILIVGLLALSMLAACAQPAPTQAPAAPAAPAAPEPAAPTDAPAAPEPAAPAEPAASTEPVKIGVITSITGERALVGEYAKNAINMAVDEVNAAGGVLGRQVEVVYEDDLGTDVGAVNALNKLATDDKIAAIVGPYYGTMILALDGEIRKAEIPILSATSLTQLADFGNPWLFQARTPDSYVPAALVDYAVSEFGEGVSIIYGTDASGVGQMEAAVAALKAKGIEPLSVDAYNSGDKDFTAQVQHVQQANPDVIIGFGLQVEAGLIMKQLRDTGVDKPIAGLASYASKIAIDLAGPASNNVFCLTDYVPSTPRPAGQVFAKNYMDLYKIDSDFTAAVEFDKFQLVLEAIRIAGSTDRTAIRDAMFKIQGYEGVANVYSFDEQGVGGTGILLTENVDGQSVAIRPLDNIKK